MRADTKQALALLHAEGLTCAACSGGVAYKSTARGVAPLLNWLDNGMSFSGFCAADKVVGAGAAYLYVLLGVAEVYAEILSESAQKVLERYEISAHFGTLAPRIRNRAGDGFCPIEDAVSNATDAQDALESIRARLKELRG
jgi:hypothetical protein